MSSYLGSKAASGLFQNIIAMMPPHETYKEPTKLDSATLAKLSKAKLIQLILEQQETFACYTSSDR